MRPLRMFTVRLRALFAQQRLETELDDEVRFHLEMQIEDNVRAGMTPTGARQAALCSFGGVSPMKETYREHRTFALVESLAQDIRYALRTLRKSPGFTATSVTVLAIAIGANTAMFSVMNAVLFRPLPYRSPAQLAMLWSEIPSQGVREGRSSYRSVEQWQSQSQSFSDIAFFDPVSVTLTTATEAEHLSAVRASPNFFPLLGVSPSLGRVFSSEECEQRQHLAVISHRFWQTHFAGSLDALGATILIDGSPSRVIGVMPPSFQFINADADLWAPYTMFLDSNVFRSVQAGGSWFVVGRLRPNVTFETVQAEMSAIALRLDGQSAMAERNRGIAVVPLTRQVTGAGWRLALWTLAGAVFCVLLIAATNVASLSLARSASREREITIRAALGASRGRIVRQLLAESLTLAAVSGLLGLTVAVAGIRLVLAIRPADLTRLNELTLDPQVFGWAAGLCLLSGILIGLVPAIAVARRRLTPSGQDGVRGIARRIRRGLVVSEFALAIVLLMGAGLLLRSLLSVESIDPGFRPERVLSMQISSPAFQATGQQVGFYSRVLEQVQSLQGVESAGFISDLFVGGNPERVLTVEGRTTPERLRFRSDEVSGGIFSVLATPLLRGRAFSAEDGPGSSRVVIINNAMARHLWPGRDPVGQRFKRGSGEIASPWFTVVGVVGDMHRQGLEAEPIPQIFEPLAQNPSRLVTLLVRTSGDDPLNMSATLRTAIQRVEKHAPVYGITTLESRLGSYLAQRRFQTGILTGFSLIALLMAAIGIYGLVQYSVKTRSREIAIRIAVGAQTGGIFRMVIGEGLRLSLTGLAIGLVGALWLGRLSAALLFGVSSTDPLTLLVVSVLLTAVAVAACYFPARLAMKVDPIVALRRD